MSLTGKVIVSVGASGGLGAGIVRRSAQDRAKTIILVGRSQSKLNKVVEDARHAFVRFNKGVDAKDAPEFKLVAADLASVQGIKDAVKEVKELATTAGGIDYLFQSQGETPNGVLRLNKDGLDTQFTVQCLSKFAFSYLLAESGVLKGSVVNICAPGGPKTKLLDLEDIDLQKAAKEGRYGRGLRDLPIVADAGSVVLDSITLELSERYPQISSTHTYPGLVSGGDSLKNFPFPLPFIIGALVPILTLLRVFDTPDNVAPTFIRFATERLGGLYSAPDPSKKTDGSPWALDKSNRQKLWEKLVTLLKPDAP